MAIGCPPGTPALRAAAPIIPEQEPTLNTPPGALTATPSPLPKERYAAPGKAGTGLTKGVCRGSVAGVSGHHARPTATPASSPKCSGKRPYPLRPAVCLTGWNSPPFLASSLLSEFG